MWLAKNLLSTCLFYRQSNDIFGSNWSGQFYLYLKKINNIYIYIDLYSILYLKVENINGKEKHCPC